MPDDDRPPLPRVTLPKNLPEILERLEDIELETLMRDGTAEAERRGVTTSATTNMALQKQSAAGHRKRDALDALPAGKASLIMASHQAGMKPAAIARSLRLSPSLVNQVLNQAAKSR